MYVKKGITKVEMKKAILLYFFGLASRATFEGVKQYKNTYLILCNDH